MTPQFSLEFSLHTFDASPETLKNALSEFADNLEISILPDQAPKAKNFFLKLQTQDPTVIFDICAQFGRINSVRIDER